MKIISLTLAFMLFAAQCQAGYWVQMRVPTAGVTYILGSATIPSSTTAYVGNAAYANRDGLTASASVSSGSNVVAAIYINDPETFATGVKIWVTDSSGNAITNVIETTDLTDDEAGFREVSLTLSSSITSASTYYIAWYSDANIRLSVTSDSFYVEKDTSGSYATPPDPMSFGSREGMGRIGCYVRLP